MLEFTLLVLPKEINASETVKSVKSASFCLWTVSIFVTKYSPSWGMQLWWKAIILGLILLDMHLNLKATKSESRLDNLHCLSAFDALVLASRISLVYHGICGRITIVYIRFKLPVEESKAIYRLPASPSFYSLSHFTSKFSGSFAFSLNYSFIILKLFFSVFTYIYSIFVCFVCLFF